MFLNFGGNDEANIRPVADQAFALAVSFKTGAYDESKTGVKKTVASGKLRKLVASLAYQHKANKTGGWGNSWQSALWASKAGFAGWLIWEELSSAEQKQVTEMVIYEANRFNVYQPPYYRSNTGKLNYPGDTKAEENSWNAMILQIATGMLSNHPNRNIWRTKMLQLQLSAFARPLDLKSGEIFHGRALNSWISGSNLNNDGTLVNQARVHPDYMTTVSQNIHTSLVYALAGFSIPKAAFINADIIYKSLVDQEFSRKHIYKLGSSEIFYPKGNLWGDKRRMNYSLLDVQAQVFKFDTLASKRASYWIPFHTNIVLDMQKRSKDGRTYVAASEDKYSGREAWVADLAAQAYLTKWLEKQGAFRISNDKYQYAVVKK